MSDVKIVQIAQDEGQNLYQYALGDPEIFVDPDGQSCSFVKSIEKKCAGNENVPSNYCVLGSAQKGVFVSLDFKFKLPGEGGAPLPAKIPTGDLIKFLMGQMAKDVAGRIKSELKGFAYISIQVTCKCEAAFQRIYYEKEGGNACKSCYRDETSKYDAPLLIDVLKGEESVIPTRCSRACASKAPPY